MKAQELPGSDRAVGGLLDSAGQIHPRALQARKDAVEMRLGTASSPRNLTDRKEAKARAQVLHESKCSSAALLSQGLRKYFPNATNAHAWRMDKWPHRATFQDRLRAWIEREGTTQEGAAERLGTTVGTLRGWLYNKDAKPNLASLQKAAALFGCSVTEFIDDPGAPPAGATPESTAVDRFILETMGSDLSKMTDAQKRNALAAWKGMADGILGR